MRSPLAVLFVVVATSTLAAPLAGQERGAPTAKPSIQVSFKLDPRLSGPTYGGERWVSPPTYRGAGAQDTVEARASAIDSAGRPLRIDVQWTTSDPETVAITPTRGEQVKITAKRAGETVVTVSAGGSSRKLTVKAVEVNGIRQVSISQ
ncbi:MAG TPA: hypothetical protein VIV57_16730 [Anaeromyxobacter sp.]